MIEHEFGVPIPGEILPPDRWTKTGLKRLPTDHPLDWPTLFGRTAPIILDLGCGNGRFTLASALARPECDHVAVDLLPVVMRYATRRANQRGLTNARFAVRDAQRFVRDLVTDGTVSEVHIYHPQPYHDPRRAHLRLLTAEFLADVHRVLVPGGHLFVQTDNPDYWTYIRSIAPVFFEFEERATPWPEPLELRSRRELLAGARGLTIYRGQGTRIADLSRAEALARASALPRPTFRTQGAWIDLDRDEAEPDSGGPERRHARQAAPRNRLRLRPPRSRPPRTKRDSD